MAEFSVQLRKIFRSYINFRLYNHPDPNTPVDTKIESVGRDHCYCVVLVPFLQYFLDRFFTIFLDRLLQYFERMKDLEKKESLEAINARLKREYERLQADYLATCAINEMWRQKVREMEKRKSELLRQRAEREEEECISQKATDNSQ